MTAVVELHEARAEWQTTRAATLDETAWALWMEKGRIQQRRGAAARVRAVTWVSAAMLLAAAGLWSILPLYQTASGLIVAACAMFLMIQAAHAKRHGVALVFGALVMLYNPLAPLLSLAGDWQRPLVAISAVPFIATFAWRKEKQVQND